MSLCVTIPWSSNDLKTLLSCSLQNPLYTPEEAIFCRSNFIFGLSEFSRSKISLPILQGSIIGTTTSLLSEMSFKTLRDIECDFIQLSLHS